MLQTCAVSFNVYTDDGSPDVGASVSATLNQFEVYDGYIVPQLVTGTTNANGAAILRLWPNELGSTGSMYTVKIVSSNGKKLTVNAVVPNIASAQIEDIAELPPYPGKTDSEASLSIAVGAASAAQLSAISAAESASGVSAYAATATTKAAEAVSSATAAATSATSAASYASSAATNAATASTQATSASVSATGASSSAATSATKATESSGSATSAATSATNASASAATSASHAASASTSAASASTSATSAATSATSAATSATNAGSSATTATAQAASASASATNAATSAQQAAASANAAAGGGIRYDISQSLTALNKTQAQSNMGLASVASSGSYSDLSNKPSIPVVGTSAQAWDADLDAIAALSGTSGFLKKTAANTWSLDTSSYLTGITSSQVTTALGFTPYSAANPSGFTTNAGTVTSVSATVPAFLSVSGTPITGSGSLAISYSGSALPVAYGGSGATTLSGILVGNGTDAFTAKANPSGAIVGTTDAQTLTNKTLTDPAIVGTVIEDVHTITDGAAFEIDPSNGSIQLITLGASRTPKATNFASGEAITLMVDDGSAYTLTWTDATFGGSGVIWKSDSGSAPTLSTSGYTTIVLWKVSTQVYGARVGNA